MKKYIDKKGVERYKGNKVVEYLLDCGGIDLNQIWCLAGKNVFSRKDMKEFYKLLSFSIDGFNDIDFTIIQK